MHAAQFHEEEEKVLHKTNYNPLLERPALPQILWQKYYSTVPEYTEAFLKTRFLMKNKQNINSS